MAFQDSKPLDPSYSPKPACTIGWMRPILVEDDDLFPSNRFKDEIENNDFEGVSLLECMAVSMCGTGVLLERQGSSDA